MVAMALIMQQVGASNVVSAKENVGYIEQEMEVKGAFHDNNDLDEWEDVDEEDELVTKILKCTVKVTAKVGKKTLTCKVVVKKK